MRSAWQRWQSSRQDNQDAAHARRRVITTRLYLTSINVHSLEQLRHHRQMHLDELCVLKEAQHDMAASHSHKGHMEVESTLADAIHGLETSLQQLNDAEALLAEVGW